MNEKHHDQFAGTSLEAALLGQGPKAAPKLKPELEAKPDQPVNTDRPATARRVSLRESPGSRTA